MTHVDTTDGSFVLEAQHVTKRFGATHALTDGFLQVRPGEIHAIVGENGAGKSTLMKILSGSEQPDSGFVTIDGNVRVLPTPRAAVAAGVGIVHQELAICPDLTVAENMFLGRVPVNSVGMIRRGEMQTKTQEYLDLFSASASPHDLAGHIPLGEQQVVEISRAVSQDCRVVIFDEPTSSLSERESEALYALVRDLKARGIASIYISHRLSEVFDLCDRVTIMRDGRWIETTDIDRTSPGRVVSAMVGKDVSSLYPPKSSRVGAEALRVEQLGTAAGVRDVSFDVKYGEIVGFSGLVGSGRSEVMRAVVGIDRSTGGQVFLDGRQADIRSYGDAVSRNLCYMTEDRKGDGLFLTRSVEDNTVAAVIDRLSTLGVVSSRRSEETALRYVDDLNIKMAGPKTGVGNLSGGNQQKVMIAKWLVADPRVLILDEPTRGIDVGAKFEIHRLLRGLAEGGMAVVIVSSELQEIVGLGDRVYVMREGRIVGQLDGKDATEDAIIALAAGTDSLNPTEES